MPTETVRPGACVAIALVIASAAMNPPMRAQAPPLRVTADDVVALALENNLALKREQFGPRIAAESIGAAAAAWTPELSTRFGTTGSHVPSSTAFDASQASIVDHQLVSETEWAQRLPWGTAYRLSWTGARHASTSAFVRFDREVQAGASAVVEQPLLKGLKIDDTRAQYQSAVQGRAIADASLNAAIAGTTREALHAYWSWVYARDHLAVQRESLRLAQILLDGNRARVAAGALAAVDVIEAEAEVARRSETIASAEKDVANGQDLVLALAFDPTDPRSTMMLEPSTVEPESPETSGAVDRALSNRQDLVALRASIEIDDISLRRARNDTLPDASVRAGYSLRGLGGGDYSAVLDDLVRSRYPAWSLELSVSYPVGRARAEAEAAQATLRRQQSEAALKAAEQRVATEVRAASREVDADRRRLDLTATAVALSERRLEAEQKKFAVGLSTSFFVFQAQRDLAQAREAALRSILDYRLASADLAAVQIIPLVP